MKNNRVSSALASTPVKGQSLTLKQTCTSGSVNKAVNDSNITIFLFASVKRSDALATPVMIRIVASSELDARRELAQKYVLSLAARLPVNGGLHA